MKPLSLNFKSNAWKLTASGLWKGECDQKNIYVMSHPYDLILSDSMCQITRSITLPIAIPEGGSVWIRFYSSDDYIGSDLTNQEIGYEAENEMDCRYRRVLVNKQTIWESDVAGPNPSSLKRFYTYDITDKLNGREIEITFQTTDNRTTTIPFSSNIYWGQSELLLCNANEQPPNWGPEDFPSPILIPKTEPTPPPSNTAVVPITVTNDLPLSLESTPVSSGIPFPLGHLNNPTNTRLIDRNGEEVYLQSEPLCYWPDGSIRWLLLDFQAKAPQGGQGEYILEYGKDVVNATPPNSTPQIVITENNNSIAIDTGCLQATFSPHNRAILESLKIEGAEVKFKNPLLSLENYYGFPPKNYGSQSPYNLQVETPGPLRTVILAEGHYTPFPGFQKGFTYILRFHFYAGSTAVKIEHTFVNTVPHTTDSMRNWSGEPSISKTSATIQYPSIALRTISLHLPSPEGGNHRYSFEDSSNSLTGSLSNLFEARLIQSAPETCCLFECASNNQPGSSEKLINASLKSRQEKATGWATLNTLEAGLTVTVRDFWQQYPKAFRLSRHGVDINLWTSERIPSILGSDPPFNCFQGQSKTHEILIHLHTINDKTSSTNAVVFQEPLRAEPCPSWICKSQAFGPIAPTDPTHFPAYEAAVAAIEVDRMGHGGGPWWEKIVTEGGENPKTYDRYGMENWGDNPLIWGYQTKYRMWSNCEYDLAHTAFQEYLRSGNPAYFRRAIQAVLHVRDVDTIHYSTVAPENVGAPHHHWIHHCIQPPNSGHLWSEGIVEHFWLTGNKRSLEVAKKLGDFLISLVKRGNHQGAERSAGWPLIALMGIYNATLDDRYLQAGKKLVEDVIAWQDPLRGVWSTAIYEQPAYEGGTTFMVTILTRGLFRYYEITRDKPTALAIVRAANWILDEAIQTSPREPPKAFYKQTPHCSNTSLIQPEALAYAYALTGDEKYGQPARASLRANLKNWTNGVPTASMRDLPRVLHILKKEF